MRELINFIKNNKLLFVFLLAAIGIFIMLILALLGQGGAPVDNQPAFPTPTKIIQQQPTPTINPDIQEVVPPDSKPWFEFLPLKNPYYYVEYDPLSKSIKAQLYPFESLSVTKEEQVESLKQRVEEKLQSIGVDIRIETIEYIVED